MSKAGPSASLLQSCVSNPQDLAGLVDYTADSVVSKRIVDKPVGTLTLFAFDVGQRLSTHSAPYDAVVHVLDGRAEITIADKVLAVTAGQVVIMPANIAHALVAEERFKMLLVMIKG